MLLGHTCVCAVEIEPYCQASLLQRQRDGVLPRFPIWPDVSTFDGKPWRGIVRVMHVGFPCQDISSAGDGAGIEGARSGLWSEGARIAGEIRPDFIVVENSPLLVGRGLAVVLSDLARMGYDARWCNLGADALGFAHHRARLWLVAYHAGVHCDPWHLLEEGGRERAKRELGRLPSLSLCEKRWEANQGPFSVSVFRNPADGLAAEVGELKATGNGQVPAVARAAWHLLAPRSK